MEETIHNAQNGDKEALNKIMKEIESPLYNFAILKLKNEVDAQDVVQDTMLLIYKNLKSLKEPKYFRSWAIRILINECNKYYKTKRIEQTENIDNITEIKMEFDEAIQKLDTIKVLDSLKAKEKNIMILHINGYKNSEIAEIMEMNENTVKTKIRRCKDKIQKKYILNKEDGTITPRTKAIKTVLMSLLVIVLMTGLVYASIIIKNNIQNIQEEKAQQVKFGRLKINMTADNEIIKENMQLYDENIYTLRINDFKTFKEKEKELLIQFEENDIVVNEETFEKYEYEAVLVTFFDITALNLYNVEPYTGKTKITFIFDETNKNKKEQQSFCILIPKKYSENIIELEYEKNELWKKPDGAITFKYREFYIEDLNEFENIDLEYNDNQKLYYTKYLNKDEYEKIKEKLGIITEKEILDKDLEENSVIIIFKETNNKINFKNFRIAEEKPCIYLQETQEQYGNGITGMIVIFKNENYIGYNVILNQ